MEKGLDRLEKVKKAEFLCGILIPREEAVSLKGKEIIQRSESVFKRFILCTGWQFLPDLDSLPAILEGFAGFFMDFFLLFKNAFCYTNGRA